MLRVLCFVYKQKESLRNSKVYYESAGSWSSLMAGIPPPFVFHFEEALMMEEVLPRYY